MTPIFLKDLPFLETPIDFNYKLNGKPILGSRKTWRGLFGGIFFAIIFILVQKLLYSFFPNIYLADYSKIDVVILGFLLGFGALFGDIIKSLIKRRFNIKPGESFFPFDELDWIIGALLFTYLIIRPSWSIIVLSVILYFFLHILFNYLGYVYGFRKKSEIF